MKTYRAVFLNLGPPSKVSIVEANSDIRAILSTDPDLFFGVEGVAKGQLPKGPGKIRDFTTPGRANLFSYTRTFDKYDFVDCKVPFPKEPGRKGVHPPRGILRMQWQHGAQVIDAHKPP